MVEAKLELLYQGRIIKAVVIDIWFVYLQTYIIVYDYSFRKKVTFAFLLLSSHSLVWWIS